MLDLQNLLQEACASTGLSDLGEPEMLSGLRVLVAAYNHEAELNAGGARAQHVALTNLMMNRLKITDTFKQHPEIWDEEVRAPIFITGLVRSGTTKLQRMMAEDPDLMTLPLWRILNPMPLGPVLPGIEDPRIAITEQLSATMREYFPDFYAGHPMNAREPDEEMLMADLALRGSFNGHAARIPSYDKWMDAQDYGVWYVFLRKMLQLFQWQDGSPKKRWLLKAPAHLGYMEMLFKIFPDATIVHCHRDPVTTTASIAKLSAAGRRMYSDRDDPKEMGLYVLKRWAGQMARYMAQRPLLEKNHGFVDVPYREIIGDTMSAIERIYAVAKLPMSANARVAMMQWDAGNPPGKHGRHSYSLESFGLTDEQIRIAFAPYLKRFGSLI